MPDINAWLGSAINTPPLAADRAADAYRRILDKPVTVAVWRGGSFHHNEIVRIEWDNSSNILPDSVTTVTAVTQVIVFGISGHATIANTDIKEGDELALSGEIYQVRDVLPTTGELQARCLRIT